VRLSKYDAGRAEFEIASGRYRFETE
jgi:hypothetical protein